jgi:prostaglandin-endoperoxide synthase 2
MSDWLKDFVLSSAGDLIDGVGLLRGAASAAVINSACGSTRNRPHPWSTFDDDYICWEGLTDRTYLARHLPARKAPARPDPDPAAVRELFARPGPQQLSKKSTCLFPAFAQYLTDGFIRTVPYDLRKTTTNHDIDLCQLYGRTRAQTTALRLPPREDGRGPKGRLKSQMINGEEYPLFLYPGGGRDRDPQFDDLDEQLFMHRQPKDPTGQPGGWPPEYVKRDTIFAVGGDRVNSTPFTTMMNTLLLREHNRLAAELEERNRGWSDERVFQTARNILIAQFIKVVIEDYINHITPLPFRLSFDPEVVWRANWNRPNWITVEFSLLYRWHSLMPDAIAWPGRAPIPIGDFRQDNGPLLNAGLDAAFSAAASQPAAKLGAQNTAAPLVPIEDLAVGQGRSNRLDTFNNYREAFGLKRAETFEDITSNPDLAVMLERLYGRPDDVEFYPGLFCEDRVRNGVLPELLMTMVAVDAFSQALTNPLFSEHVWKEDSTFTQYGRDLIRETSKVSDILARNVKRQAGKPAPFVGMTQASWRYGAD